MSLVTLPVTSSRGARLLALTFLMPRPPGGIPGEWLPLSVQKNLVKYYAGIVLSMEFSRI